MSIDELYLLLLSDNASLNLRLREGELFDLIPELKKAKGFNQNSVWHVYDVYEHILHVVDYVPNNLALRLAALFHDVGKVYTYSEDENKVGHFYGHWNESLRLFRKFSNKYNIDKDLERRVSNLIYYHDINVAKLDDNKLNELINTFDSDGIRDLYELKRADLLAQNSDYHYMLKDLDKQENNLLLKYG